MKIRLELTLPQAKGLLALADEGANGLFTDDEAAKGWIGNNKKQEAAKTGLNKLIDAIVTAEISGA